MSPKKSQNSDTEGSSTIPDTRIEDGKLLFEKRWYKKIQLYKQFFDLLIIFLILGTIEGNQFLSRAD